MSAVVHRNTRQKAAIRAVFERNNRPLSPREVLEFAQKEVEGLGIATVYRNLKSLYGEGWLERVEMPGGTVLYEPAGKDHHHHFQCDQCGRVFELEGCVPAINELAKPGFQVNHHELVLYGICPGCRRSKRQ